MRIVVIGAPVLGSALAQHLHLSHIAHISEIRSDDFVLNGDALDLAQARALDVVLRGRAAEVDAVLWCQGGDIAVVEHYGGRTIAIEGGDLLEAALDALREVAIAT